MASSKFVGARTLADGVEQSILDYIQKEKLVPGDILPHEEEFAAKLNVSRHIVREGVSRLKTFGLLESRKNKGMILSRPNAFAGVAKFAEADLFSSEDCHEFMWIRVVMEIGMAEFVFDRCTSQDIVELRKVAGTAQRYQKPEVELAFHSKLFAIGGNFMANQFLHILATAFKQKLKVNEKLVTPSHLEICDTLEHGSKAEYINIIKAHFEPHINW